MDLHPHKALDLWRLAVIESVRRDDADLSARQMGVLLTVYLTPQPHTVRALVPILDISKPAVTRALDRLEKLGLVRRRADAADRRSVLIQRTVKGSAYLGKFGEAITRAAADLGDRSGV